MSFTISYPTVGSTSESITLRNPEIGDVQRIAGEGIVRRTIGGDLKTYRDANWPQSQINVYQFTTLTAAQKNALMSFLEDYNGLEVAIEDHNGVNWTGVIISTPVEVVTTKDACSYDVSIEFLGARV